jgi:galacturan 1,4-alpha-galacturonidase
MNGTNMWFDDMYVNATAVNAPYGTNWVQNTDGFDTMDAHNIGLTNMVYQGGDDCIAVKPRSYNIYVQNVSNNSSSGITTLICLPGHLPWW